MHNVKSDIVYGYDPTTGYLHTAATTFKVSTPFTETITYGYKTTEGSRSSMTIDGDARVGGHQAFSYLADGYSRMTSVTNPSGNTTAWSYDSNDTITTQAWNPATDNVTTTYSRTPLEGRLQSISNAPPTGSSLSLFNSGQMYYTADNQIVGWGGNRFIYNEDHRVQSDNVVGGDWAYDGMGNITSASGNELPGYTDASRFQRYYNADNQWMGYSDSLSPGLVCNWVNDIPSNPNLFNYDTAGNPTTYKGDTLEFDFANRLLTYSQYNPTAPAAPTPLMKAQYGANGLRAWKMSYGANGTGTPTETNYLYDGDQPIMEFDANGHFSAINTWGPNGLVSREDNRDGAGMEDIYYLYDPLGNVVQRLNDNGATLRVRSSDTYDAYGNRTTTGTMETVDANDPWGYKAQYGYYTDYETKLILCEHRYYDPFAGHWLTRDPIGYAGGLNLYEYCGGDPIEGSDSKGLAVDPGVPIESPYPELEEKIDQLDYAGYFANKSESLVLAYFMSSKFWEHGGVNGTRGDLNLSMYAAKLSGLYLTKYGDDIRGELSGDIDKIKDLDAVQEFAGQVAQRIIVGDTIVTHSIADYGNDAGKAIYDYATGELEGSEVTSACDVLADGALALEEPTAEFDPLPALVAAVAIYAVDQLADKIQDKIKAAMYDKAIEAAKKPYEAQLDWYEKYWGGPRLKKMALANAEIFSAKYVRYHEVMKERDIFREQYHGNNVIFQDDGSYEVDFQNDNFMTGKSENLAFNGLTDPGDVNDFMMDYR